MIIIRNLKDENVEDSIRFVQECVPDHVVEMVDSRQEGTFTFVQVQPEITERHSLACVSDPAD